MVKQSIEESLLQFYDHFENAKNKYLKELKTFPENNKEVVIAGMGGSGIAGKLISDMFPDKRIFAYTQDTIPQKHKDAPIIAISYSGNTEETIKIVKNNLKNIAAIISAGGELKEIALKNNLAYYALPAIFYPRASLPYMLPIIFKILNDLDILSKDEILETISRIENLKNHVNEIKNHAQRTAKKHHNKIQIILAPYEVFSGAYRIKTDINENSKIHAFSEAFSEHNHNSLSALDDLKGNLETLTYLLFYKNDNSSLHKRFKFFEQELQKRNIAYESIALPSNTIEALIYLVLWGGYYSIELGKIRNIDIDHVPITEALKQYLKK